MIARDPESAARRAYDVAVVGGGIHGAAVLLDAARRGLSAVLVERDDFGGGTSWNSLRVIHGGLRYLQTADLARFRESVRERAWLNATFPELVRPLGFLLPLGGTGLRRPLVLRAALAANDALTRLFAGAAAPFPRGRVLDAGQAADRCPLLANGAARPAALWHDGHVPDSHRLVIEMLAWACAAGAVALNRMTAESLEIEGGRVARLVTRDTLTGAAHRLACRHVILCAGASSGALAERFDPGSEASDPPSLAFNLLIDRPAPCRDALALPSAAGPEGTSFLIPFKGMTLAGTRHAPLEPGAAREPEPGLIASYVAELNAGVPGWGARAEHVRRCLWGLLPVRRAGTTELTSRPRLTVHARRGGPAGLVSLLGIKLTTARAAGRAALRAALGRELPPVRPAPARPEPAHPPDAASFAALVDRDRPAARAAVRELAERESAHFCEDVLLRRADWGLVPDRWPGTERLVAEVVPREPAG